MCCVKVKHGNTQRQKISEDSPPLLAKRRGKHDCSSAKRRKGREVSTPGRMPLVDGTVAFLGNPDPHPWSILLVSQ